MENDRLVVKLISNHRDKARPFLRDIGKIDYLTKFDLDKMRALGHDLVPTFDDEKKIVSINYIDNSNVACEICEDSIKPEKNVANYRVQLEDDTYRMVCRNHRPLRVRGDTNWQERADLQ